MISAEGRFSYPKVTCELRVFVGCGVHGGFLSRFLCGVSLFGDGSSMGGESGVSTVILDSGSHVSVDVWFKVFIFEWGVVFFISL